ncbi:hypothetical protein SAY86_013285 [Trapa natans]|uniref:Stress-induced protein KIN2-like n=1 Tax=Trapa natans TaxID=22666 RepID=A0AAN7MFK0_TRANT|nr:hypothetical protein SAY86_013285 [Trapa natans]
MNTNSQNLSQQAGQVQGQAQVYSYYIIHNIYNLRLILLVLLQPTTSSRYINKVTAFHMHVQEKTDQMMGGISNTAQLVKESCQQAGEQMKAKAQDATEAVKNAIGANK